MDCGRRQHRAAGVHVFAQLVRPDGAPAPQAEGARLSTSVNGWHGLTTLRWFMLVTIILSLALVYAQASRRSPALPVTLSLTGCVVALITLIALIYRVLINEPGPDGLIDQKAGAFVGLIAMLAIVWGGFLSLREEGVREADGPGEIDTIPLTSATGLAVLESDPMLDRDQVLHVARLARLELSEEEVERMANELSHVLDHIEKIRELDLDGVPPTSHVIDVVNALRRDEPEPSLPAEVALAAAPEPLEGGFGVPSPGAQA